MSELEVDAGSLCERVVALAQRLFRVQIVLVSVVEEGGRTLRASAGLRGAALPLDGGFCAQLSAERRILIVPDALLDARFAAGALVRCEPHARFYAGAAFFSETGRLLGTLELLDPAPRLPPLGAEEEATLLDLAALAAIELTLHDARKALAASVAHGLNNPLAIVVSNLGFALEQLALLPGPGAPELAAAVRDARDGAERISKIVRETLRGVRPAGVEAQRAGRPQSPPSPQRGGEQLEPRTRALPRILVIDDEPMVGLAVERTLRVENDVTLTASALQALQRLKAGERFDLVLCDVMMPEMSGIELEEAIRALDPEQARRMVFLTGGAFTSRTHDFLEQMGERVLEKPFTVRDLRAFVAERLAKK